MESKILYHVHKSLAMDPTLIEMNPVRTIHLNIIFQLNLSFQSGHFLWAILTFCMHVSSLISTLHAN
jgi:hypothetical protein